jgi:NAD(P)-dependent dehydrogenase (short-subunit alcohol dehydrogenase family)
MNNFENKTVFITGGASGIGLALARAFGKRGANIMIADINEANLEAATQELAGDGINVESVVCNVVDLASVQAAADATLKTFGKVHMVVNNAGVSLAGKSGSIKIEDWRWIVDINLMGVVHGIEVFTPILLEQGEGGYFINTASMAGHLTMANLAPYNATKYAVVGYSESLMQELKPLGIGVSVLCPTWIQTNIHNASKDRPSFDPEKDNIKDDPMYLMAKHVVENGLPADTFAELVVTSVAAERFYIFTDPKTQPMIDARRDLIMADYDACLADLKELQ